jgi:predicted amidohydrolase YtcJ
LECNKKSMEGLMKMNKNLQSPLKFFICSLLSLLMLNGCATQTQKVLYTDGSILTMRNEKPDYVESVVTENGRIVYVGDKKGASTVLGSQFKTISLHGKTMLPGFIDAHGHVYMVGLQALSANLLPPPDGQARNVSQLISILNESRSTEKGQFMETKTGWIVGFGYDDSLLDRYPTAADLDKVSTDKPVIIIHNSGHLCVVNNKALKLTGIDSSSKNPEGGVIRRQKGSLEPDGVLEETAMMLPLMKLMDSFDKELEERFVIEGQKLYASFGYTTAQDGRASASGVKAFVEASSKDKLFLDVVSYPDITASADALSSPYSSPVYKDRFRIGGVKLNLDGSPQGKTAWLSHPYHEPPKGLKKTYLGYPTMSDEKAFSYVDKAFKNNWQILVHANGDAAIDQFINAVAHANKKYGKQDRRPVLIHGQTMRKDQIERVKAEAIFPSLFPMHTFYWGDYHRDSVLGPKRAAFISPTRSVLKAGLKFSSHHDAPVANPNALRVLDATVNRVTRSKKVLGADERVEPYIALKAMTEWVAYQHFEEETKGTIEVGKKADFVILDKDPLKVDPLKIAEIKVESTVSNGKVVYERTGKELELSSIR